MKIGFKNVIIPYHKQTSLVVENGLIKGLYDHLPSEPYDLVIEGNQQVLMPGFNDSHGHFLGLSYH